MILSSWAQHWGVSADALADLQKRLGIFEPEIGPTLAPGGKASEAAVQARIRLVASRHGVRLWRNNVGAGFTDSGSFIRWGLANDDKKLNNVLKSSDLIGIRPRIVQYGDVGKLLGQFISLEVKHEGWKYSGTDREIAQRNWIELVTSLGGEARFISHEKDL